jgi:integrase
MARTINRLTDRTIRAAKSPDGKQKRLADGQGLYLRISTYGTKDWVLRYMLDGVRRDMGLGAFPTTSLDDARRKAADARKAIRDHGVDPIDARDAAKATRKVEKAKMLTFRQCAEACIKAKAPTWKSDKHAAQWTATLDTYAFPLIGDLPVAAVDAELVRQVLAPIWTTKAETASRLRGRIETVLNWAKAAKLRSGENPAAWQGNLDSLLGGRSKAATKKHHAALPYKEIGNFMETLRGQNSIGAKALQFTILTASRTNEVLGARWSEIDLEEKMWIVPPDRMKAAREHRVALSDAAVAIISEMAQGNVGEFVFPSAKANRPLSNMVFLMALKRMGRGDLTAHGFRSTFRDWVSERTGFPAEVAEMALAHIVSDKTERAYRRGDLLGKRYELMEQWAAYCAMPMAANSATVTVLADRRPGTA